MNASSDLRTATNSSPGVNHGAFVYIRANIAIRRHEDYALALKATAACHSRRNHAHAAGLLLDGCADFEVRDHTSELTKADGLHMTGGSHHDLLRVFEALNARFFSSRLEVPITWGRGLAVYRNQQVLDLEINPLGLFKLF